MQKKKQIKHFTVEVDGENDKSLSFEVNVICHRR